MPEALAILAVFFVAGAVYVYAWLEARNPATQNAGQDQVRLRHHAAWLQDRLRIAQQEGWDAEMVASIAIELDATNRRLREVTAPAPQGG